ncbi:MAG: SufS family cysteine desulfurase, partial [Propionibacteriaceae bacterium]
MTTDFTTVELDALRAQFPVLGREVNGHPLTYLDSANTSQKPLRVLDRMRQHDMTSTANVARALHTLGAETTAAFEGARSTLARFIGAAGAHEIVFTKNASEALNLAAHTLGDGLGIGAGDEIVISVMEHHSNIVPWQMLCQRTGAILRWFDITDDGRLDLEKAEAEHLINEKTKILSLTLVSNVLGTVNPVTQLAAQAHAVGATVVVDAAQAAPHQPLDVATLGADLVIFTGHKMCGPSGIGVLWGRYALLEQLPPFLGGGEMIEVVRMAGSTYAAPPARFEAGTPPITQAIGLGEAATFLTELGLDRIAEHEHVLTASALEQLSEIEGLRILGPTQAVDRGSAIAFALQGIHPHDVMQLLDSQGVAVRGGHHCARPLHDRLGVQSSVRASIYCYTSAQEIDCLVAALRYTIN